jgi:hypothetical protein
MQQSPSLKTNIHSPGEEVKIILPSGLLPCSEEAIIGPNLTQLNPACTATHYFRIYFNIILVSTLEIY